MHRHVTSDAQAVGPYLTFSDSLLNQWLFLRPNHRLSSEEIQELELVLEVNSKLALGYRLKEEFQLIIAQHDAEALDGWIANAAHSELKPFQSLAKRTTHDMQAIRNGLDSIVEHSPV